MNYHELTMGESRDSPEKRKQFLLICTVMVAALVHSIVQAGGLEGVAIEQGTFPGGDFVYKETKRDYAASASLEKVIGKNDAELPTKEYIDRIYTLYLDDPNTMGGRRQRFASGYLITKEEEMPKKDLLLSKNEGKSPPTEEDILELGAISLWPKLLYHEGSLPTAKAATVQFAHTGGFVSAMIFSLKIVPQLRAYAKEHAAPGSAVTILSTCSTVDNVCTHYAPLEKGDEFLLGHEETSVYMASMPPEEGLSISAVLRTLKKILPPLKWILDGDDEPATTTTSDASPAVPKEEKEAAADEL